MPTLGLIFVLHKELIKLKLASYMLIRIAVTQSLSIAECTKQAGVEPHCTDVHANTGEFGIHYS